MLDFVSEKGQRTLLRVCTRLTKGLNIYFLRHHHFFGQLQELSVQNAHVPFWPHPLLPICTMKPARVTPFLSHSPSSPNPNSYLQYVTWILLVLKVKIQVLITSGKPSVIWLYLVYPTDTQICLIWYHTPRHSLLYSHIGLLSFLQYTEPPATEGGCLRTTVTPLFIYFKSILLLHLSSNTTSSGNWLPFTKPQIIYIAAYSSQFLYLP